MNGNAGIFLVSLDFELLWGIRDFAGQSKVDEILRTRQVVPRLLEMFQEFDIHATWATVGFLFFDSRNELIASLPKRRPSYANHALSPYENLVAELGVDEKDDPSHYAPSLIRQIIQTPHQEMATHTFSHYYCLEEGQTPEDFDHDLKASLRAAEKFDLKSTSIAFPRNQYDDKYLTVCAGNGLLVYRGTENLWFRQSSKRRAHRQWGRRIMRILDAYFNISGANAYSLPAMEGQLINLPSSRYLRSYSKKFSGFEPLRLKRITSSMTIAAKSKQAFHLWWHPEDFSKNTKENLGFLRKILMHYAELQDKYGMQSYTMQETARLILEQ